MRNHLGEYASRRKYNATQRLFLTVIFLHRCSFCIRDHLASMFVLSVAVIVRFAIESFCSLFSRLFRDWDCWFYKYHRSFFNFNMFYEYNHIFLPYPPPICGGLQVHWACWHSLLRCQRLWEARRIGFVLVFFCICLYQSHDKFCQSHYRVLLIFKKYMENERYWFFLTIGSHSVTGSSCLSSLYI